MQTPPFPAQPPPLSITISRTDADTIVVTPAGDADLCTARDLQEALARAVAEGPARLVVDLDQLSFMDAITLSVLVESRVRIHGAGGQLSVRCGEGLNRRLLVLTGLQGMLEDHSRQGSPAHP